MTELSENLKRALDEIKPEVEGCMYDLADPNCSPEKTKAARKNNPRASAEVIRESVADDCYNDTRLIADLVGDRIHDAFIHAGEALKFRVQGEEKADQDRRWNAACEFVSKQFTHLPGLYDMLRRAP